MKLSTAKETKKLYYPIPVSGMDGFKYSLVFGLFVALFLWFFEPFDINIQAYSIIELLFFGFISFSVFFVAHTVLPLIIPNDTITDLQAHRQDRPFGYPSS